MAARIAQQTLELYREISVSVPKHTQDLKDAMRLLLTSLTQSGDYVSALQVKGPRRLDQAIRRRAA
jgi:hypothetical protein